MNQVLESRSHGERQVNRVVRGTETSDGMGVRLTRIIGGPQLPQIDPFLLLDDFRSDDPDDYIGGFPDHPHHGFETVTYLLEGRVRHRDSAGHAGVIESGAVQWMTAGAASSTPRRGRRACGSGSWPVSARAVPAAR